MRHAASGCCIIPALFRFETLSKTVTESEVKPRIKGGKTDIEVAHTYAKSLDESEFLSN